MATRYHAADVAYAAQQLELGPDDFDPLRYADAGYYAHQQLVYEHLDIARFDAAAGLTASGAADRHLNHAIALRRALLSPPEPAQRIRLLRPAPASGCSVWHEHANRLAAAGQTRVGLSRSFIFIG